MSGTPWMPHAWQRLGEAEIAGPDAHNEEIVSWWRIIGLAGIKDDERPNCAAFVLAMLVLAGVSIDSMPLGDRGAAIAFETFGAPCDLHEGAIVVTRRHDPKNPRARHAGFLLSWTQDTVTLLNANIGDKVCVATFPRGDVTAVRWPEFTDAAEEAVPVPPAASRPAAGADASPASSRPWWELMAISRTIRGALHTALGGIILFFQNTLQFALDAAAKVAELAPLKPMFAAAGANVSAIGFGFVVWGVSWVAIAKLTPKAKPSRPA